MNADVVKTKTIDISTALIADECRDLSVDVNSSNTNIPLFVTKPYLPKPTRIQHYVDLACRSRQLTNRGPLEQLLTERLKSYLQVDNLLLVSSGTIALQIAQAALGLKMPESNVITTPFTFVATASSLVWEGIEPRFSDIDPKSLCMDPSTIAARIDSNTRGISPVHVFGNACDIENIESIARRHRIKTLYDCSHAFGVRYRTRSILEYGDATTLSFHATKLFHTVEGGAIVFKDSSIYDIAREMTSFGYRTGEIQRLGINAKLSEIHAAFGLAVLEDIDIIFSNRASLWNRYHNALANYVTCPTLTRNISANNSYFPIILENENTMLRLINLCESRDIYPRRYFHPSLNTLEYMPDRPSCPISESTASRIVCLPLYPNLDLESQQRIIRTVQQAL